MRRLISLSFVLLSACDISTRVGDLPEEEDDFGLEVLPGGGAGTSTEGGTLGDMSASTGLLPGTSVETEGGTSGASCIIDGDSLDNCPRPPEDWCDEEDRSAFPLPDGLAEYWDSFCTPSSTEESGLETSSSGEGPSKPCLIDGEWLESCSPPPVDWCEQEDRSAFPLPDGLAEYWDSFCTPGS